MITLVFDYDGTLHDSMKIYAPSFRKCCEKMREDGLSVKEYTDAEIKHWIGMDVKSMWNEFRPDLSEERKNSYGGFIGSQMTELIRQNKAVLYDGVSDMLEELKQSGKYRLVFLSSCKREYMEAHIKSFGLDRWFEDFYCTEDFGFIPKYEIFGKVRDKYDEFVVIGDRLSDIETAEKNGGDSIGCAYGYGTDDELKNAGYKVKSIIELKKILLN